MKAPADASQMPLYSAAGAVEAVNEARTTAVGNGTRSICQSLLALHEVRAAQASSARAQAFPSEPTHVGAVSAIDVALV
jgi:hypothetical protein